MIGSLQCNLSTARAYAAASQIARVVTEQWCSENLYCAACDSDQLDQQPANTKALDFRCSRCSETYQLKSQRALNLRRIVDGAYSSMLAAVQRNAAPNIVILNYDNSWAVRNLVLIPSLFFTESVLEKRKPLSSTARRAGWVGCNLVLSNIPADGKIALVENASIASPAAVREKYRRYSKLESLDWSLRGWTLDVLKIARNLGKREFALHELYECESELMSLHPNNRNIRAKIRQQLQVLRDLKLIEFVGDGNYRFLVGPYRSSPGPGIS